MSKEIAKDIELALTPNPEGDNSFKISITEGEAKLSYFASKKTGNELVNAGDIELIISDCVASKYLGSEPEGDLYPGWHDLESDLCEIENSKWAKTFIALHGRYRHYVFSLNHQIFECIAQSCRDNGIGGEQCN
ncbi:MAG: hypothetical protein KZQ98_02040 [Candidatus Thiodiazotropha sp. (ex Lucinoma borealis)]|nr:hypothetical protein [Candidatus Thiodiazotropha sp. (ex Lucinoma borealis)]